MTVLISCGQPHKRNDTSYLNYKSDCNHELSIECAQRIISNNHLFKTRQMKTLDSVLDNYLFFRSKDIVITQLTENTTIKKNNIIATLTNVPGDQGACTHNITSNDIKISSEEFYKRPESFYFNPQSSNIVVTSNNAISAGIKYTDNSLDNCNFKSIEDEIEIPDLFSIFKAENLVKISDQYFYQSQFKLTGNIYATISHEDSMNFLRHLTINFFYQRNDRNQKQFINLQVYYTGIKLNTPRLFITQVLPDLKDSHQFSNLAESFLFGQRIRKYTPSIRSIDAKWIVADGIIRHGNRKIQINWDKLKIFKGFEINEGQVTTALANKPIALKHYRYNEYLGPVTISLPNSSSYERLSSQSFHDAFLKQRNLFDHRYVNRVTVSMRLDADLLINNSILESNELSGQDIMLDIDYIKTIGQ